MMLRIRHETQYNWEAKWRLGVVSLKFLSVVDDYKL